MFNLFKKQPEPGTQLTDQISVDNLKAYVVEGYDKEKALKSELSDKQAEIELLKDQIKEHDALKVVLDEKQQIISNLEFENKKIATLQKRIEEKDKMLNNRKIIIKNLQDERETLEQSMKEHFTAECQKSIASRLEQHKGNLSKAKAIELVKGRG